MMFWDYVGQGLVVLLVLGGIYLLCRGIFFSVHEGTNVIVERFGKFTRVGKPGLQMKIPLIDKVAAVVTLKVRQLEFTVDTKTSDQAFVSIPVVVQYAVDPSQVREAHYLVEKPVNFIADLVSDYLRGQVPQMEMEKLFAGKLELAGEMLDRLGSTMSPYGYQIRQVLITDMNIDEKTRHAMQMRFAAQRAREAALDQAEAEKLKLVKAAEAEAEARKLEGQGIAEQRRVIAEGLRSTLAAMGDPSKVDPELITKLMVMSQYFDSLEKIGGQAKVIFLPHTPGGVSDLEHQLRNAMMTGIEAYRHHDKGS